MPTKTHAVGWRNCFPTWASVAGHDVSVVEEGWDFQVVRVAGFAVRIPRRVELGGPAKVECRVLPELAPLLPVRLPEPAEVCPVHGSMAYPWIPGRPLSIEVLGIAGAIPIADQLAGFVTNLHRFPLQLARDLGVGGSDLGGQVERFRADVLPVLPDRRAAARFLDEAQERLRRHELRVVHGDLGPAHLLCDGRGLTAVIDWTDLALGDPAQDVAWILNGLGRRLRGPFLAALPLEEELVARADVLHRLGPWWEVLYGLDNERSDLVESGISGIEGRLPREG